MDGQGQSGQRLSRDPEGQPHERNSDQQDVWNELFGTVKVMAETVELSLQAFASTGDDKAVSATTKKRLAIRAVQGLRQSQQGTQTLLEHLKALQAASKTWQRSMMYASKGHQELMEQVETTTQELHVTSERLRGVEAQRLAAVREAEALRGRVTQLEEQSKGLQAGLQQREEELETAQFTAHEARSGAAAMQQTMEQLQQAAHKAEERAATAVASLDDARAEATRAQALAERHQQVVAKLTADNLMFLMQLKKAEADLAASNQERAHLRLAAEKQRGPWFDQVRAGVEERVRQAMQHSQELEARLERLAAEKAEELQAAESQRAHLQDELAASRQQIQQLRGQLDGARTAEQGAEARCAAAEAAAAELRQRLEDLAAENRVLQDSVRSMRQECTERWVSEQAALGRVGGLEQRATELSEQLSRQTAELLGLRRQLDGQAAINRQLMARKEEVEWQLMAAMAKVDGGGGDGPVPLNLMVSGMLQVGGKDQTRQQPHVAGVDASLEPRLLQNSSRAHAPEVAVGDAVPPRQDTAPLVSAERQTGRQQQLQAVGDAQHSSHAGSSATSAQGLQSGTNRTATSSMATRTVPAERTAAATAQQASMPSTSSGGQAGSLSSRAEPPVQAVPVRPAVAGSRHTLELPMLQYARPNYIGDSVSSSRSFEGSRLVTARQTIADNISSLDEPDGDSLLFPEPSLSRVAAQRPMSESTSSADEPLENHGSAGSLPPRPVPSYLQEWTGMQGSRLASHQTQAGERPLSFPSEHQPMFTGLRSGPGAADRIPDHSQGSGQVVLRGNGVPNAELPHTLLGPPSTAPSSPPSSVILSGSASSPRSNVPRAWSSMAPTYAISLEAAPAAAPMDGGNTGQPATGVLSSDGQAIRRAPITIRTHAIQGRPTAGDQGLPTAGAVVSRRGSLHEGGDIWYGDIPSSPSSSGSDFFFDGGGAMVVQHAGEGSSSSTANPPANAPHQQVLNRLQLELQEQLLGPSGDGPGELKRIGGASLPQPSTHMERYTRAPTSSQEDASVNNQNMPLVRREEGDADDVIRVRPAASTGWTVRTGPSLPKGAGPGPGAADHTSPSQPTSASVTAAVAAAVASARAMLGGGAGGTGGSASGPFSITRREIPSMRMPSSSGSGASPKSPVHPLLSPASSRYAPSSAASANVNREAEPGVSRAPAPPPPDNASHTGVATSGSRQLVNVHMREAAQGAQWQSLHSEPHGQQPVFRPAVEQRGPTSPGQSPQRSTRAPPAHPALQLSDEARSATSTEPRGDTSAVPMLVLAHSRPGTLRSTRHGDQDDEGEHGHSKNDGLREHAAYRWEQQAPMRQAPSTGGPSQAEASTEAGGAPAAQPYRSQGAIPHPAYPVTTTAVNVSREGSGQQASGAEADHSFLDPIGSTPSKRISALSVAVTAVPRGPMSGEAEAMSSAR